MIVYLFDYTGAEFFFVLTERVEEVEAIKNVHILRSFIQESIRDLIPTGAADIEVLYPAGPNFSRTSNGDLTTLAMAGLIDEIIDLGKLRW